MYLELLSSMEPKFKVRDIVRILDNSPQKQYVGSTGRISKVYPVYSNKIGYSFLYRVNVKGKLLKGVACEDDLEMVKEYSNGKKDQESIE